MIGLPGKYIFFLRHGKAELRRQREVGTTAATIGPCVPIILCMVIQIYWYSESGGRDLRDKVCEIAQAIFQFDVWKHFGFHVLK